MALSVVNHTNTTTDGTATKPTNTAQNDLIVILAHHRQSSSGSFGGFTNSILLQPVTQHRVYVWWKIAGSSEPSSWSITNCLSSIAITFRGVDTVTLPDNWVEADTSANTGTLNTERANSFLLDIAMNWNSGGAAASHSTPSGYTARGTVTEAMPTSGGNYRVSAFVKETATAIGGYSVSNTSGTGNNGSALIEIKEPFVRPKSPDFFQFM